MKARVCFKNIFSIWEGSPGLKPGFLPRIGGTAKAVPFHPGTFETHSSLFVRPGLFLRSRPFVHAIQLLLSLVLAFGCVSCSRDSEAAATKKDVTVEPGRFEVEHPELFKLAKTETRELPILLTANGTVNPDVTRTIHVSSLGSGRV